MWCPSITPGRVINELYLEILPSDFLLDNEAKHAQNTKHLNIGNGKLVMANPDGKGQAELNADTDGQVVKVRLDGSYLIEALRACGWIVDFKLTNAYSPTLLTTDGYKLVVMPMLTDEANKPKPNLPNRKRKPKR